MTTDFGRSPSGSGSRPTDRAASTGVSPVPASIPNAGLPRPGKAPCGTCPYRRDVPAGVWHPSEYAKLPEYDGETWLQPTALFFCHQQDGRLCAGWVGCHDTQRMLAVRLHQVAPETFDYQSPVPLFVSGAEAATHGLSGVREPDSRACRVIETLVRKRAASAIEAFGRDGETRLDAKHESAVAKPDAKDISHD